MSIEKKMFKLPVERAIFSTIKIEASILEEAVKIANNNLDYIKLPSESTI